MTSCPHCRKYVDIHSDPGDPDARPDDGSISICWGCLRPSKFQLDGDQLILVKLTPVELTDLATNRNYQTALAAARGVKNVGGGPDAVIGHWRRLQGETNG